METCFSNPTRDSLLLLKERIIKAEILLNKYACLSKKFHDLEVSHSQAVENEKRAKKDAAKYLEKYCKLTKKCNSLTSKINSLEETIKGKVNELEEYQNEFVKLESVIQMFKTERKGHQSLKRDKDFLLTHLWKIIKQSDEGPKNSKIRKLGEIFFKKFEKDLAELKLEDFRKLQLKNNSKLPEFHETTEVMCSSPGSHQIDSDESDLVETDSLPTIENLPALNLSSVSERVTNTCGNGSCVDKKPCINNITSVEEIKGLKNDPKTAIEPFISEENGNTKKTKVKKNHKIVENFKCTNNSGINNNKNDHNSGNLFNSDVALSPDTVYNSSDSKENYNLGAVSYKDPNVEKELISEGDVKEKIPGKFSRTYVSRKFKTVNQNERCNSDAADKPNFILRSDGQNKVEIPQGNIDMDSEGANSFTLPDRDCSDSSSEIISLDIDDKIGDLKNLPEHSRFYEKIPDSLTNLEGLSELRDNSSESSTSLLFLMENNWTNHEPEISTDNNEEICSKSTRNFSIFDVQDAENTAKDSGKALEGVQNTCLEFTSDNRDMIDLNEDIENSISEKYINRECEQPNEVSNELENINVLKNDKPQDNINLTERLLSNDMGPEDGFVSKNSPDELEKSDSDEYISDEEIYKILRSFAPVRLLSPIRDKEPNVGDIVTCKQNHKQEEKPVVIEDNELKNSTNNLNENMIISKPDNRIEEPLTGIGNVLIENKKMVDKFVQTLEPLRASKGCQKSGRIKKTAISKRVIKKICNIIWKRNLKFSCANHFANYMKSHSSCFAMLKMMFGMFKCHKLQHSTRAEERLKNLLDKGKGHNKNRIGLIRKPSWEVNDVEVTEVNLEKIQDPFNYSIEKANDYLTHVPNFHNSNNTVINNYIIRSKEIPLPENKSFVWATPSQRSVFGSQISGQSNIDEEVCEGSFSWEQNIDAEINFQSDVKGDNFKKENEGFLKAGAEVKCLEDSLYAKTESGIIPGEKVANAEFDALKTEGKHFEACREAGKSENDRGKKLKGTEKPLLRRSSRIKNRNMLISGKSTSCNKSPVDSPPETKSDSDSVSDSDEIGSNISLDGSGCSQNLKQKFEDLFGESELNFEVPEHGKDPESILEEASEQDTRELTKNTWVDSQTNNKKPPVIKRTKPELCHINTQQNNSIPKCKKPNLNLPEEGKTESNGVDASHKTSDGLGLLDSIMSAMTKQTEEFKVKVPIREPEITNVSECGSNNLTIAYPVKDNNVETPVQNKISKEYEMNGNDSAFLNLSYYWGSENNPGNHIAKGNGKFSQVSKRNFTEEKKMKNLVQKEISNFVKMDIGSVEEGQEKVKSCITVLEKAGEDTVANVIVSEIMANVDEELQDFDRPAPPLTRTQHRIMIILACLGKSSEDHNGISYKILKIIWSKLFPENFFWPDDAVEMASRFYAALCKRLNNFKGIWKFCFKAISCMRQRWCLPIFVVLQVWPDILHNAHEIQENILVNTFVNVILHTPKTEEMRRKRQEQKLLAIKHLLINFYNFDCNSTIEGFTQQLLDSHIQNVPGSLDALVLVSKCRAWSWTRKNVMAKLLETLEGWLSGTIPDTTGFKTLDVIHQTIPIFPGRDTPMAPTVEDIISTLAKFLNSDNLKQSTEEKVIKILCSLCHYTSAKDILCRSLGKFPSDGLMYSEIKRAINSPNQKAKGKSMRMTMAMKMKMKTKMKLKKNTNGNTEKRKAKKKGKRKTKKKASSQKKVGVAEPSEQTPGRNAD